MSKTSLCKSCRHFMHRMWEWPHADAYGVKGGGQVRCKIWGDVERNWIVPQCSEYEEKEDKP